MTSRVVVPESVGVPLDRFLASPSRRVRPPGALFDYPGPSGAIDPLTHIPEDWGASFFNRSLFGLAPGLPTPLVFKGDITVGLDVASNSKVVSVSPNNLGEMDDVTLLDGHVTTDDGFGWTILVDLFIRGSVLSGVPGTSISSLITLPGDGSSISVPVAAGSRLHAAPQPDYRYFIGTQEVTFTDRVGGVVNGVRPITAFRPTRYPAGQWPSGTPFHIKIKLKTRNVTVAAVNAPANTTSGPNAWLPDYTEDSWQIGEGALGASQNLGRPQSSSLGAQVIPGDSSVFEFILADNDTARNFKWLSTKSIVILTNSFTYTDVDVVNHKLTGCVRTAGAGGAIPTGTFLIAASGAISFAPGSYPTELVLQSGGGVWGDPSGAIDGRPLDNTIRVYRPGNAIEQNLTFTKLVISQDGSNTRLEGVAGWVGAGTLGTNGATKYNFDQGIDRYSGRFEIPDCELDMLDTAVYYGGDGGGPSGCWILGACIGSIQRFFIWGYHNDGFKIGSMFSDLWLRYGTVSTHPGIFARNSLGDYLAPGIHGDGAQIVHGDNRVGGKPLFQNVWFVNDRGNSANFFSNQAGPTQWLIDVYSKNCLYSTEQKGGQISGDNFTDGCGIRDSWFSRSSGIQPLSIPATGVVPANNVVQNDRWDDDQTLVPKSVA